MVVYTAEQLAALTEAIAQGALRVRYSDKEVQYRSLSEMLQLQGIMEASVNPIPKKPTRLYAQFNKGV